MSTDAKIDEMLEQLDSKGDQNSNSLKASFPETLNPSFVASPSKFADSGAGSFVKAAPQVEVFRP